MTMCLFFICIVVKRFLINHIMENIDISKYNSDSLEYINRLSEILLEESVNSIRELTNKSYVIIGVYFSIQVFCLEKIISETPNDLYIIIGVSFLIPIIILFKNLLPTKINFVGSKGSLLIHKYYEDRLDGQIKHYLSNRIQDLDESNNLNGIQVHLRSARLKWSIISAFIVIAVTFWTWYIGA